MRVAPRAPARIDIARLVSRLPPRPVTRFAPSPTGHLHLGHAVNAIYVWGIARALGGTVQLRIENHDLTRSRRLFEQSILDDLDWLGVVPDSPSIADLRSDGPCDARQMDRPERYRSALSALTGSGLTYWCDCSRKRLDAQPAAPDGERAYDGHCRQRGLGPGPDRGVRVTLEPGAETFDDGRLGKTTQNPASQCGDVLVRDRLAQWTYQLAVAVDDWADGVSLVIRGEDLLASTGRQIAIGRLIGRPAPAVFLHHPLVANANGQKLSKANRDSGVGDLRRTGMSPAAVLGMAAAASGLIGAPRDVSVAELGDLITA